MPQRVWLEPVNRFRADAAEGNPEPCFSSLAVTFSQDGDEFPYANCSTKRCLPHDEPGMQAKGSGI